MERIGNFLRNESGVTAIEYALIAALISVVIATAVGLVGTDVGGLFSKIENAYPKSP